MTQEAIQISETPPLPGLKLVQDTNKAFQTIATDFAGPTDPAGLDGCGPYCKWADTANGLRKRRNAANTGWEVEGKLFVDGSKAENVDYDGTAVDLSATDVQGAIDEIAAGYAKRNGDDSEKFEAAPATALGEVVTFAQAFGLGQTKQDVTASRSLGVTYVNTTPAPIKCTLSGLLSASNSAFLGIQVDGSYEQLARGDSTLSAVYSVTAIVPVGATYQYDASGHPGALTIEETR